MSKHVFHLPLLVLVMPHSASSPFFTSLFELGPHYGKRKLKLNCRIRSLSKGMSGSFVSSKCRWEIHSLSWFVWGMKALRCNYFTSDESEQSLDL